MLTIVKYEHIRIGGDGVARIAQSTMKVSELIAEKIGYGWSPEELHLNHPHLSMGEILSALAYYADNQTEIEEEIFKSSEYSEKLRKLLPEPPLIQRLRTQGLL